MPIKVTSTDTFTKQLLASSGTLFVTASGSILTDTKAIAVGTAAQRSFNSDAIIEGLVAALGNAPTVTGASRFGSSPGAAPGNGSSAALNNSGGIAGTVFDGAGNDTLRGGANDDSFICDLGGDRLMGSADDGLLHGGNGKDLLTGGAGSHQIVFLSAADVCLNNQSDRITDYASGVDVIDFSFPVSGSFIGGLAFGSVARQVRCTLATGQGECGADGNGEASFTLLLNNLSAVVADDFLLWAKRVQVQTPEKQRPSPFWRGPSLEQRPMRRAWWGLQLVVSGPGFCSTGMTGIRGAGWTLARLLRGHCVAER